MGFKNKLVSLLSSASDENKTSDLAKSKFYKRCGLGMLGVGSAMVMVASYIPYPYMFVDVIAGSLLAIGGFISYMAGKTYTYDPDEAEKYAKEVLFKPIFGKRSRIAENFVGYYSRRAQEERDIRAGK